MTSRSLMVACVVLVALVLALPAMAQGGPPPGAPQGGMPGPGGPPGGMGMPGMGMQGGNTASAPPVMLVAGDFLYVAWMGTLSQYKVSDLSLVKSVPLPMPERTRGGRGGRDGGGPGGAPGGAPPPPPAPAGG